MNFGTMFGKDGLFDAWNVFTNSSAIGGMMAWADSPDDGVGDTRIRFGGLFGENDGSVNTFQLSRNVIAHINDRGPKINNNDNSVVLNNLTFNARSRFFQMSKNAGDPGWNINVEGNIYLGGTDTSGTIKPIQILGDLATGTNLYLAGNRATISGITDEGNQNPDLVLDQSSGAVTISTSARQATHPAGYSVESIGAGEQGEQDAAEFWCSQAGPRPGDPNRLSIYQMLCDNVTAIYNDAGDKGTLITDVAGHPLGFPTLEENSCDPTVANSCGAGMPALPVGQAALKDTTCGAACSHINAFWTYVAESHCLRMPAGATGCP